MSMRITNNMQFDYTVGSMSSSKSLYNELMTKLSTQKEVNRISDDPMAVARIMDLRETNTAIDQYNQNIDKTSTWVSVTTVTLTSVSDWIQMAKGLAATQASGTDSEQTDEDRENIGNQIEDIRNQILSLANSKLGDRYLFGGSKTDVEPFQTETILGVPTTTYEGNDEDIFVSIGKGSKTAYNITGEAAFTWLDGANEVDVFHVLNDLKAAIDADPQDVDEITTQIDNLGKAQDQVTMAVSSCETKTSRMEMAKNNLADLQQGVATLISKNEDANISELAMQITMKEVALQACYGVAARLQGNSLLSFLK